MRVCKNLCFIRTGINKSFKGTSVHTNINLDGTGQMKLKVQYTLEDLLYMYV